MEWMGWDNGITFLPFLKQGLLRYDRNGEIEDGDCEVLAD